MLRATFFCVSFFLSHPAFAWLKDFPASDNGIFFDVLLPPTYPTFWTTPCRSEECRATKDILAVVDALAHILLPNTMAYATRQEAQVAFDGWVRTVQGLGWNHPRRIPIYCRLLTRVAHEIDGESRHDQRTSYNLINMTLRLNRPGHNCLAQVAAAVPKTEAAQASFTWELAECLARMNYCYKGLNPPPGPPRPRSPKPR